MKLKIFTLHFDPDANGFDDAAMQEYLCGRQVVDIHEHFFVYEGVPRWALLVSYRDEDGPLKRGRSRDPRKDWRAELSEEERGVYDAVVKWRNARARRDGRPPYVLLTNRQVAKIARSRPSTLETLREIDGIGDAKTRQFGAELVGLLRAVATGKRGVPADDLPEPPGPGRGSGDGA